MIEHRIPDQVPTLTLERYMRRAWPLLPGHVIRDALKRRDIRVNGVRCAREQTVAGGDSLTVYLDERWFSQPAGILWTDEKLIVAVKPQGLPVDVDQDGVGADTLLARLKVRWPSVRLCHRLDAATGGIVMAAADEGVWEQAFEAFRAHGVRKTYRALALRRFEHREGTLHAWLEKDAKQSRVRGLHRVGVYVPGGTAGYPSSVLMNVIPAQVAQVGEIVMATPPGRTGKPDPNILAAAYIAGVDRVFLMGGAQAVAALALGTESVPKVDKIVGPGNIFVATAKKQLYGVVDIDMIAGPSEILIVADETANPRYLAADLMSQAEHDPMASAILITNSRPVAEGTVEELTRQMATLSRREIIQQSLDRFGGVIICENLDEAVDFANELAPEHLEVCVQNPFEYIGRLDNAGSVFLGNYSPEPLGDYFAGANHVLPTGGTARFFSPLSVDDFIKTSSFIYYPKAELQKSAPDIIRLAETEELTAHANSICVRVED